MKPYRFNRTLGAQKASSKYCQKSNESYESKTGCNGTLATVLRVPLMPFQELVRSPIFFSCVIDAAGTQCHKAVACARHCRKIHPIFRLQLYEHAVVLRSEPPFTGVSGPSGPKFAKKSQRMSFGGSRKKVSKKGVQKMKIGPFGSFLTFWGIFGDFLADPQKDLF